MTSMSLGGVTQAEKLRAQIDLSGMRWVTLAQAAVILPHLSSLPVWLILLVTFFSGWRWFSYQGHVPLPGAWLKAMLLLGSIGAFFFTYRGQFSVEAAVAFFTLAYALKVLELQGQRDLYLFIFLSFFLLAMIFLFDQSLLITLYVIAAIWICLIGLSRIANPASGEHSGYTVAKIMLQALPLMLIAYLMFPRIAPLWKVPMNMDQARTGISDRIKPGDIAELAQSGERAFRVSFDGEVPPQEELYWRGLSLDSYRQGEWRDSGTDLLTPSSPTEPVVSTEVLRYEVIQEPTGKPWGFALQSPLKGEGKYRLTGDGFVRFPMELRQPARYSVGMAELEPVESLTPLARHRYTALPDGENPATRAWISQLKAQVREPEALVAKLMNHFREQPFFYTLRPEKAEGDPIDHFLFQSRRGFCAHYASALTYGLRLADIPARMIVGYQGGEWHRDGGYLMVHQYDAHAWVEVWLDGRGWVRYDPTAMVAPDRISEGIREALAQEGSFLEREPLALSRYGHWRAAQWLRLRLDQLNYNWQRWVVQYDGNTQLKLFQRWYEDLDLRILGLWLLGLLLSAMGLLLGYVLWRERLVERDPLKRLFHRFEKKLARRGLVRHPGETPRQFADRAGEHFPAIADEIRNIEAELERNLYASGDISPSRLSALRKSIRGLRVPRSRAYPG